MRKIHIITQKENVNEDMLVNSTSVVIDVFLATSTIIFLLENNYQPVYTTDRLEKAIEIQKKSKEDIMLMGEDKGTPVQGFAYPDPTLFERQETSQAVVFRSTNGTIAIESAKRAKQLYLSSLVNNHKLAKTLLKNKDESSIVIICSGNDNRFSMEDFVGAGHLISHLVEKEDFELSDGAKVALQYFEYSKSIDFINLLDSETKYLLDHYKFNNAVQYVIDNFEKVDIVPTYKNGSFVK